MTLYGIIFYLLGAVAAAATALAITRRHPVHAVVYLVVSFFALAPLFYLLGAPLLALLEIIIYAGAIMVLFLFIIMMLRLEPPAQTWKSSLKQWWPALMLSAVSLAAMVLLLLAAPGGQTPLGLAMASPREFGRYLFARHWLAVEIASLLLFVALVGAWYLGRREEKVGGGPGEHSSPSLE